MGTIPVLVKRLKQKDLEWRKARQELNKGWRDVLDKNYDKSFDHRSFYFRQSDKRFHNAKYLIADIKPPEAPGAPSSGAQQSLEELLKAPGISTSLDDDLAAIATSSNVSPQLVLEYNNKYRGVHKDIYKIIVVAVEAHNSNVRDKERVGAIFRDLFRPFFHMPVHYLYEPGTTNSPAETEVGTTVSSREAWAMGSRVLTIFGPGIVTNYRSEDVTYCVQLPFGMSYLNSASILGGEELSKDAVEALGLSRGGGKIIVNDQKIDVSSAASNYRVNAPCEIFYGTQVCYCFMRLYHTLFVRLCVARDLADEAKEKAVLQESAHPMTRYDQDEDPSDSKANGKSGVGGPETKAGSGTPPSLPLYSAFLAHLAGLVDGSLDVNKFEDFVRQLLGNNAYIVYTLDKVIQQLVKCLTSMAADQNVTRLMGLYMWHRSAGRPHETGLSLHGGGGVDPDLYHAHVSALLGQTLEDVYRIQLVTASAKDIEGTSAVTVQVVPKLNGFVGTGEESTSKVPSTP